MPLDKELSATDKEYIATVADALAAKLYARYCEAVGGKAFNNDPLPTWEVFKADPNKQKQSQAWLRVAEEAMMLLSEDV